jgi:Flp pilus assembly protein TadG
MRMRRVLDDAGQAAPLVLVVLLGLLAVAGLVIDGGLLFSSRRSLQSLADGAARAGAMAVDERSLRESGGTEVLLDVAAARDSAGEYLRIAGFSGSVETEVEESAVLVRLTHSSRTLVLSLVGIGQVSIRAEATAYPSAGITGGGL